MKFILILFSPYLIEIPEYRKFVGNKLISSNIKRIVKWYQNPKRNILNIHLPEHLKNKINVEFIPHKTQIIAKITYDKFIYDNIAYYAKIIIDPDDDGNYSITLNKQRYLVGSDSYVVKCI